MVGVLIVLGMVLALEIIFPAILSTWWLLFPPSVERARLRIERTLWQCFWLGALAAVMLLPLIVILFVLPLELTRLAGSLLFSILLALTGLGAAGLVAKIKSKKLPRVGSSVSAGVPPPAGNAVLELATGVWLGSLSTAILLPAIALLLSLPFKLTLSVGCSLFFLLAFLIGVGWAAKKLTSMQPRTDSPSSFSEFIRGTVILELSAGFPVIGWLFIAPFVFLTSLGATIFALCRWEPKAAPAAARKRGIRELARLFVFSVWALVLAAISLSVMAFFVRGAVAFEVASRVPANVWFAIVTFIALTVLGAVILLLLRWVPRVFAHINRARMKAFIVPTVLVLVFALPLVAISLIVTASDNIAVKSIPEGLLHPLVSDCDEFVRYHPVDYSKPIEHVAVPQHTFMAPNPGNNMHADAYMSDTYETGGPLGLNPQVISRTQGFGGYGTICFDSEGRIVGVYGNAKNLRIELLNPNTLELLACYELPARSWGSIMRILPWKYIGAGMYFYLDEQNRAVVPTTKNTIQVVQVPDLRESMEFQLVHEYDLSSYIVLGQDDSVAFVLPDWSGRYYWYATTAGIVGTVNIASGEIHLIRFEKELIENSFAVGEDGVFIISDHALYRLSQTDGGNIVVNWRTEYDRGTKSKPGVITRGSGCSVTLMGAPEDGLVAITDNAEPRIDVLFVRRSNGEVVGSIPVFEEGRSATDLTVIGFEHADANGNGTGVYSAIVENNWGHHTFPLSHPEPGLTRVDATRHDDGTYSCGEVWASNERSIGGFRLSFGNGLVYQYGKDESSLNTKWYFTAVDFATGKTVYKKLTGTGLGYNNWAGSLFLHPDGMVYSTTIFGLVMMRDTAP